MTKRIRSTSAEVRHESGEVSAETVIAVPVVFMVLLMAIQAAVFVHTVHVAQLIAAEGAQAAARYGGGVEVGAQATFRALVELRAQSDGIPRVELNDRVAEVTVNVKVPRVAPFFDLVVTRTAQEPVERVLLPGER